MATQGYQTILLVGAPGAGKGTQGKILGQIPGFFHLSCGEVFRTIDIHSELGKAFYEASSRGELVSDEVTVDMWHENMHAQKVLGLFKPNVDLLVLDGIPRNVNQARLLREYVKVLKIIRLVCPDKEEMIRRLRRRALKENRADDAREDVIRKRWEVYEEETKPILDFYPSDLIAEVSGIGSPGKILQTILENLVPVQELHFTNPESGDIVDVAV